MSYKALPNRFKGKKFPRVWDKERLEIWDKPDLYAVEIQSMAVGLTRAEVLEYYNLEEEDLPEYDHFFFDANYKRGRTIAKQAAAAKLFDCMGGDAKAAMAYLTRFGKDEWQDTKGSGLSDNQINVVLDGSQTS